jgi:cell shape-determining protein MreD
MEFEIIGIAATLFVLASFIVNDIKKVRIINLIGAFLFVIYGYCIKSFSTLLLNVILIGIHIFYLRKEFKKDMQVDKSK